MLPKNCPPEFPTLSVFFSTSILRAFLIVYPRPAEGESAARIFVSFSHIKNPNIRILRIFRICFHFGQKSTAFFSSALENHAIWIFPHIYLAVSDYKSTACLSQPLEILSGENARIFLARKIFHFHTKMNAMFDRVYFFQSLENLACFFKTTKSRNFQEKNPPQNDKM